MRKRFGLIPLITLVVLALIAGVFALHTSSFVQANTTRTIHVVEHAITDTEVPAKDALGNQLVFHNPAFAVLHLTEQGSFMLLYVYFC